MKEKGVIQFFFFYEKNDTRCVAMIQGVLQQVEVVAKYN